MRIKGGAFYFLRLPNSGVDVDLPLIGYFPTTVRPDAGLAPDVSVRVTADDIARQSDPEMQPCAFSLRDGRFVRHSALRPDRSARFRSGSRTLRFRNQAIRSTPRLGHGVIRALVRFALDLVGAVVRFLLQPVGSGARGDLREWVGRLCHERVRSRVALSSHIVGDTFRLLPNCGRPLLRLGDDSIGLDLCLATRLVGRGIGARLE